MIKIVSKIIIVFLLMILSAGAYAQEKDSLLNGDVILKTMKRVTNWQLDNWQKDGSKWPLYDWTNATGYVGLLELGKLAGDLTYINYLVGIGEKLNWETGPKKLMADDYCIGQVYAGLYLIYKRPVMISKFKLQSDTLINLPHTESLAWKNNIQNREWAWCDAMFMGPTSLWALTKATGDLVYGNEANVLWWKTKNYLYDDNEHLYYRDSSYFTKREANGQKVFWSRGNGWVLGGLVRILQDMPVNFPDRPKYVALYREMIARIARLQQPDGSWHASLLDPASYPVKEASGTGFYDYAILWGLNHHLLDRTLYWPVARKAWLALNTCIQPDGMLGFVQKVGAAPDKTDRSSTEIYGVGAFLLAGTQLYEYQIHYPADR